MESPGNSNGQRTVSGSPGRAEQGVAGIPPGMDAHLSGAPCQSGCQGFVGQGLSAGSFQQGFLNSDPWANWINQRQFYNQQLLLQQQFRDAQSVPVPPSVSSTPGNQGPVYQGQGFGGVGRGDSVTQVTRMLQQLSPGELQSVLQSVGQLNPGFKPYDLGDLYDDVGLLPGSGVAGSSKGEGMRSGLEIPPQSIIKLGRPVKTKCWGLPVISRNFQVGPHKGRLSLGGRLS